MIGLTLGKFLPFHKGHELLIKTASNLCDDLFVLVGVDESDPYTFRQRKDWIEENYFNNVFVIAQKELDKNAPKDADGTITDETYWKVWLNDTRNLLKRWDINHIDVVFTSDLYGERIARELNAKWVPVDPDREIIPTSGTKVRADIENNFSMLPSYVRKSLVKTVAILGPESVGKSTLIKKLSNKYTTIPEYGRILSVNRKNNIDFSDFRTIQYIQQFWINEFKAEAKTPVLISDTEALITALYADLYLGASEKHKELYDYAEQQHIDKYIVLAPNVPWVQDGFRVQDSDIKRYFFFYNIIEYLRKWKKDFTVIDNSNFIIREALVSNLIEQISSGKT